MAVYVKEILGVPCRPPTPRMFYFFLFNFMYNLNAVVTEDVENIFFFRG